MFIHFKKNLGLLAILAPNFSFKLKISNMRVKFKHIALADDDDEDKELLQEAIKRACPDIFFTLADNGAILLDKLKTNPPPDFIILDINMPYLNGKDCLKIIKSKQTTKEIPVMVYSTSSNMKDVEEAFSNGADYYVIKPNNMIDIDQLAKEICSGTIKSCGISK